MTVVDPADRRGTAADRRRAEALVEPVGGSRRRSDPAVIGRGAVHG
ncbi:hypothetical protein [Streptomyces hokutonensis]